MVVDIDSALWTLAEYLPKCLKEITLCDHRDVASTSFKEHFGGGLVNIGDETPLYRLL